MKRTIVVLSLVLCAAACSRTRNAAGSSVLRERGGLCGRARMLRASRRSRRVQAARLLRRRERLRGPLGMRRLSVHGRRMYSAASGRCAASLPAIDGACAEGGQSARPVTPAWIPSASRKNVRPWENEVCAGYACLDGACATSCSTDGDCAQYHACSEAACVPVPRPYGTECAVNSDCESNACCARPAAGTEAVLSTCQLLVDGSGCGGTTPCESGTCLSGVCAPCTGQEACVAKVCADVECGLRGSGDCGACARA